MTRRNAVSTVVLVSLLGVLGWLGYSRLFRVIVRAKPAALAAPYTTEEAWVIDEIVRDVTEMASPAAPGSVSVRAGARPDTYVVSRDGGRTTDLDLHDDLWSVPAFSRVAAAAWPGTTQADAGHVEPVHEALLDLTAPVLVAVNERVSSALRRTMGDARLHESAALLVGAFGLRESFGRQADTRWALNRMTAHLAIADALRRGAAPGVDGRLALAVQAALKNHQTTALATLDALVRDTPTDAVAAWSRGLRMHVTMDWRLLPAPASGSRLEQREYFRARRATLRNVTGSSELAKLGRPMDADWFRILTASVTGVEDASLVTEALDMERAEIDDVYQRLHGQPLVHDEVAALNMPATRAVVDGAVQVLSWGAWAEFEQRRLAAVISRYDSYLRHSLGAGNAADTMKVTLHDELGGLWIFPGSTMWWTKGPRGKEADGRYLPEAIAEGVARPHRLPSLLWVFMEFGSKYEPVSQQMAPAQAWFFAPAPRTAYEAGLRVQGGNLKPAQEFERLIDVAPHDFGLVAAYLASKYGQHLPYEELQRRMGERLHYDAQAVSWALASLGDDERRLSVLEAGCTFAPSHCPTLGRELARRGKQAEAAQAYEKALEDPAVDDVAKTYWSGWLVQHYAASGQVGKALRLAESSSRTGSANGLIVAGRLYERLERYEDAEEAFRSVAARYDASAELVGFYHRAVNERRDQAAQEALARELERVFPDGLSKDAAPAGAPAVGVYVEHDSLESRKAGLQTGDVIVGVDGWRVDNVQQYQTVKAFLLRGGYSLDVARGTARRTLTFPDRTDLPLFNIADYPLRGWIEK
jgi:tetratricopeptide (TPR) repeat protein